MTRNTRPDARPAVFLDRDGTLNVERDFLRRPDELELIAGVAPAVDQLIDAGYRIVVLTNQSGIARGFLDERQLVRIHDRLQDMLREASPSSERGGPSTGPIDAFFHCPHHPDLDGPYGGKCSCRKPASGMLHRAAQLLNLDLQRSWMIGDSARDVLATRDTPVRSVLVASGKPIAAQQATLADAGFTPDHTCRDLAAAVPLILA